MERAIDRASAVLAAQHGVAHVAQLARVGLTGAQVRARVASGSWVTVAPAVVGVRGAPDTDLRRVWCAVVRTGVRDDGRERPVAVGGLAAAALLGAVPDLPECVEVVVSRDLWCPRPPGVRVRKVNDWGIRRFVRHEGLLVTALPDTLVDVAPYFTDAAYHGILQDRCFGSSRLLGRVVARCHRGSKGSARARRVGAQLAAGLDSPLHARGVHVLRRAGLAPALCDVEVAAGAGPSDCVYVTHRRPVLALEFDGDVHRLSRRAFLHDRAKDLLLREAGCQTLRFTAEQVERPARMVADVGRALAAAQLGMSLSTAGVA
ncbi:MAG TPA: hypothetical protein VNQ77_00765 [Frankiaceae bacterium]|nr:hypothetical protein [Frankiaceae bacterium]